MSATPSDTLDALKVPDPAPTAGRADDLLSQMAGDEINRLLADAEIEPERTPAPRAPAEPVRSADAVLDTPGDGTSSPSLPQDTISKELDQVFSQQVAAADAPPADRTPEPSTGDTTAATPPSDPAASANPDDISADGVADLLGRLSEGDAQSPPSDVPAAAAAHSAEAVGHDERAALAEPHDASHDESHAGPQDDSTIVAAPPPESEGKLSRLIDWITMPLDPFPDEIRDVIGKVAIVTAINAVAILVYVMVFR
ncbi:hypothetical protein [Humisphaera borealis]|uniref:Uncharacterized protein n=1 Tax=Humisphaera borealis TaxID=2807512 RepID=A0A7M2WTC3_9BACT|nr:hypothetical protein [Humisphaera borealis]QOV88716.1 hypothetical protein IPV69_21165 [Humisphaera borealis]